MKIASWNVNSVRARLQHVTDWIQKSGVDILCLQEVKVKDEDFPVNHFIDLGFYVYTFGQPAYNGVAFISKYELQDIQCGFKDDVDGFFDKQKRLIAATVNGVRLINVYAPNGDNPESDKFEYKEKWYTHLRKELDKYHNPTEKLLLCGDLNIAPEERDVYDPVKLATKCGFHPLEHKWLAHLQEFGLEEAFRIHNKTQDKMFTWWDYRHGGFEGNRGMRIDGILVTKPLAKLCIASYIDIAPRTWERPSDHTPIVAYFDI